MKIAVLDAQGAGLGQTMIKRLKRELLLDHYIIALGTNSIATSNMVRAGANVGLSGETAILSFCTINQVDCIIGPIGVICAGGINGEITPTISGAVLAMDCVKYILPLQKHGIFIPGTRELDIREMIDLIIQDINNTCA